MLRTVTVEAPISASLARTGGVTRSALELIDIRAVVGTPLPAIGVAPVRPAKRSGMSPTQKFVLWRRYPRDNLFREHSCCSKSLAHNITVHRLQCNVG
jgi:hypothetical protein